MRHGQQIAVPHFTPTPNEFTAQFGEIRGGKAFDLLQLLNTGHSGSLSTLDVASARQGLARVTSCVLQSGVEVPYRVIKTQRIPILALNRDSRETVQRITGAERAASPDFQAWVRHKNANGSDT
jgi:Flp pilus assembly CpaF family ATPase